MAKQRHFIREWRKHRGLTQEKLAERIGVDRTLITHIEKGRRDPDLTFLEIAAEILQCAPADLIIRDPSQPDGIWSIWDTLKPAQQTQLVEIGKTLKRTGTEG
jgi:transcriptional regulator with XRE-family HTH domain